MKKFVVLVLIIVLVLSGCSQQSETVADQTEAAVTGNLASGTAASQAAEEGLAQPRMDSVTLKSQALGMDMRMKVYLPKGYSENKKFPVLYLFHGMRDNENTILHFSSKADRLIDEGKIEPLIIAAPYIVNSFGSNTGKEMSLYEVPDMGTSLNTGMYEDYITKDVIPYVKDNYSVIPSKEGQYAGGISMGGYVALHLAFKYPDSFSKVGGHSAAIWFEGGPRDWLYPNEKELQQNDPIYLAQHSDLKGLQIYLDCGDRDDYGFQNSIRPFYDLLKKQNLNAEFHLNNGGHNMGYWGEHAEEYLAFYSPVKK